ncbi:MAG: undecaprenyl/decaprenyl-phosphate alpha-N-acetylglucosaminyl 1-phosphate transferase [Phycisphaerales bacterium]|nr:undecaprenyl/decaprenyl-phosphate alpha-N-acetylglucosaminyl 1-phosphate transferase [Phycisphaerales bacterium]
MLRVTLILLAVGFAISLPTTWIMRHIGRRVGALDSAGSAGHAKQEIRPIPNTGGTAIYLGIALPLLVGLLAAHLVDPTSLGALGDALAAHLPGIQQRTPMAVALLACLTTLHVMGVIDDRRPLGPWLKLAIQAVAAAVLVVIFDVRLLTMLDDVVGGPYLSWLLTIAWFIAVTNAINFMDNMDGLAGGVSAIAAGLFLVAALLNGQWFVAVTLALLVGSVLGFLVYNRPPASIFMGDGGSLVIGFLIAFLTVRTTYYGSLPGDAGETVLGGGWYAVFMPVIVLAVPLYDLVGVVALRLSQGKNPMRGDQQHFSHRLVMRGMSTRAAVLTICAATLATGIGGIALGSLSAWQAVLVFVQTGCILGVLAAVEFATAGANNKDRAG